MSGEAAELLLKITADTTGLNQLQTALNNFTTGLGIATAMLSGTGTGKFKEMESAITSLQNEVGRLNKQLEDQAKAHKASADAAKIAAREIVEAKKQEQRAAKAAADAEKQAKESAWSREKEHSAHVIAAANSDVLLINGAIPQRLKNQLQMLEKEVAAEWKAAGEKLVAHKKHQADLEWLREKAAQREIDLEKKAAAAAQAAIQEKITAAVRESNERMAAQLRYTKQFEEAEAKATAAAKAQSQARIEQYIKESNVAQVRNAQYVRLFNQAGDQASASVAPAAVNVASQVAATKELNKAHLDTASAAALAKKEAATYKEVQNDLHAATRGLAGGLNALWLTYGGAAAVVGTVYGLTTAYKSAVVEGAKFEYQLMRIAVVTPEGVKAIDSLRESFLAMSKVSPFSATDIAKGAREYVQAGNSVADTLKVLPDLLKFATFGELNLAEASKIVTAAMTSFKLPAEDAVRVMDVMVRTANDTRTNVHELGEAFKQASTIGLQYNVSIEETNALLGVLAQRGITGSAAGTALRNMFVELTPHTDRAKNALKQIGLTAKDLDTNTHGVLPVLEKLRATLDGFDKQSVNEILNAVFNERGAKAAYNILLDLNSEYTKLLANNKSARGANDAAAALTAMTTLELAKTTLNTFMSSLETAFAKVEPEIKKILISLKETFGSAEFIEGVKGFIGTVTDLLGWLVKNKEALWDLATAFAIFKVGSWVAVGVEGLAVAVRGLAIAMGGLTIMTGFAGTLTTIAALANPIGLLVASLAAGAYLLTKWVNERKAAGPVDSASVGRQVPGLNTETGPADWSADMDAAQLRALSLQNEREERAENFWKSLKEEEDRFTAGLKDDFGLGSGKKKFNADADEQLKKANALLMAQTSAMVQAYKGQIALTEASESQRLETIRRFNRLGVLDEAEAAAQELQIEEEKLARMNDLATAAYKVLMQRAAEPSLDPKQKVQLEKDAAETLLLLDKQRVKTGNMVLDIQTKLAETGSKYAESSVKDIQKENALLAEQNAVYLSGGQLIKDKQLIESAAHEKRLEQYLLEAEVNQKALAQKVTNSEADVLALAIATKSVEGLKAKLEVLRQEIAAREELLAQREEAKNDPMIAMANALNDYMQTTVSGSQIAADAIKKTFKGVEDAIVNFAMTGKLNVRDMLKTIAADVVRYLTQSLITRPLAGMLQQWLAGAASSAGGSLFSSLFGTATGGAVGGAGGVGGIGNLISTGTSIFRLASGATMTGLGNGAFALANMANSAGLGGIGSGLINFGVGATGGTPAAGSLMGALGQGLAASGPYLAAAAAIATLYQAFSRPRGGEKDAGSFIGDFSGSGSLLRENTGWRMYTGNQLDSQMRELSQGTATSYAAFVRALGGTSPNAVSFGFGADSDPRGTAQDRVTGGAWVNGREVYMRQDREVGRNGQIPAELQLESQRALIAALQATDMPEAVKKLFTGVDAMTLTADAASKLLSTATEYAKAYDALNTAIQQITDRIDALAGDSMAQFTKQLTSLADSVDQAKAAWQSALAANDPAKQVEAQNTLLAAIQNRYNVESKLVADLTAQLDSLNQGRYEFGQEMMGRIASVGGSLMGVEGVAGRGKIGREFNTQERAQLGRITALQGQITGATDPAQRLAYINQALSVVDQYVSTGQANIRARFDALAKGQQDYVRVQQEAIDKRVEGLQYELNLVTQMTSVAESADSAIKALTFSGSNPSSAFSRFAQQGEYIGGLQSVFRSSTGDLRASTANTLIAAIQDRLDTAGQLYDRPSDEYLKAYNEAMTALNEVQSVAQSDAQKALFYQASIESLTQESNDLTKNLVDYTALMNTALDQFNSQALGFYTTLGRQGDAAYELMQTTTSTQLTEVQRTRMTNEEMRDLLREIRDGLKANATSADDSTTTSVGPITVNVGLDGQIFDKAVVTAVGNNRRAIDVILSQT